MTITQTYTPTIRMDCHTIMTNWCPNLCHPNYFYAGCPSWHNPPNLSWLGTGTKYAGCIPGGLVAVNLNQQAIHCTQNAVVNAHG